MIDLTDGTGDNARDFAPEYNEDKDIDKSFTNVLKLHLLAGGDINEKRNDIEGQICLYERGIGARSRSSLIRTLRQVGGDLSFQTKPMLKKLEKVYEPGDKIYITGFSRGSASARKFAVDLSNDGLTTEDGKKVKDVPIEFLGCFETVSMQVKANLFDILSTRKKKQITKSDVLGEDGKVAPNVKNAVHLVALDDNRMWSPLPCFPPILMGEEERVHEAWFAGEHGDVGGNFYTKGIPDCACSYMQSWMIKSGLEFMKAVNINPECLQIDGYPDIKIKAEDLSIKPNPSDKIHINEKASQVKTDTFTPSYRPVFVVKGDDKVEGGVVNIHVSVLQHMKAMKEKGGKYPANPLLKETSLRVVGYDGEELESETEELVSLLKTDY